MLRDEERNRADEGYGRIGASALRIMANLEFSSMMMGWQFQMQSSTDLVHWTNSANPFMPGSDMAPQMMDTAGPLMFWRLQANP